MNRIKPSVTKTKQTHTHIPTKIGFGIISVLFIVFATVVLTVNNSQNTNAVNSSHAASNGGQSAACTSKGGTCKYFYPCTNGSCFWIYGICPGPSNWVCWVPAAPGGPGAPCFSGGVNGTCINANTCRSNPKSCHPISGYCKAGLVCNKN